MVSKAKLAQSTVPDLPPEVGRILRRRARARGKGLNQLVVEELTAATIGACKRADFGDLVGQWMPDPEFDAIVASQRPTDEDLWI